MFKLVAKLKNNNNLVMFTKLAMTSSKSSYFDLSKSYNFLAIFFTYSIMKIVKGRFAICGILYSLK